MGGDALSGAAAGIAGEFAANAAYQEGSGSVGRQGAIAIGQAVGAAAALATSSAQGKSDEQTATNVGIGGFIGMNAAANNSTFVDKRGKILKVDENDGDTGVYVDNGNGTKTWVAATPEPGSFEGYQDKNYAAARIHFDKTINIEGLSQAIANEYTPKELVKYFSTDQNLDIKKTLISMGYTGNPMDGIIRQSDGMIIPVRSAGNQTYGQSIVRENSLFLTEDSAMKAAGAYQQTQNKNTAILTGLGLHKPYGTAPYWGEESVTGKDIIIGYQGGNYPTTRTDKLTDPKEIIKYYIEVKK